MVLLQMKVTKLTEQTVLTHRIPQTPQTQQTPQITLPPTPIQVSLLKVRFWESVIWILIISQINVTETKTV